MDQPNKSRRPSPSMMVSLLALFVALGGTATAAGVFISSTKQIAKGAVTTGDLAPDAVIGGKVKDGSLSLSDLNKTAIGTIQTAGSQALEAVRPGGPEKVSGNSSSKVATLSNIPPGAYAVFAKSTLVGTPSGGLLNQGGSMQGRCDLKAAGGTDESSVLLGTPGANTPATVNVQTTTTFGSVGQATLECAVDGGANWTASQTSIIAIRVGNAPKSNVTGR
jgi:hypothetical protein